MSRLFVFSLLAAALCRPGDLSAGEISATARVLKHSRANGPISTAIVMKGAEPAKGNATRQHVILVDTSASQVGEHRQQALLILDSLLKSLPDGDRVRLFAVDLRADPLDDGFHDVRSPEVKESLELLTARVPLGATNLEGVLRTAMQSATDQPTDITYIGDGMSTADLVEISELRALVSDLRQRRISVHSFGIGAQRNLQILGILAQQTGGYIDFDTQIQDSEDEGPATAAKTKSATLAKEIARVRRGGADRAADQGKALAKALKSTVFFPTELRVEPADLVLMPSDPLPIRTDRETIYLVQGAVPVETRIVLTDSISGDAISWKLAAPLEQPGATFLPVMIAQLQEARGMTNPLAGMPLFLMSQSDFTDHVTAMAQRGAMILQLGQIEQAAKILQSVVEADPNNDAGKLLQLAIDKARNAKKNPSGQLPTEKPRPKPAPAPPKR